MRLHPDISDRIVAVVAEKLPESVRVKRRASGRLVLISKPARFERVSSGYSVFADLSPYDRLGERIKMGLRGAIEAVSEHLDRSGLRWPGLDGGPVRVAVDVEGDELRATVRDSAGHVLEFSPMILPTGNDLVGPTRATESIESVSPAMLVEFAAASSEVDSIALWLLRVGIDHTGRLSLTRLWDAGIRAAVLADLKLSGRVDETAESIEVDTEPTGVKYEDAACRQLLAPQMTELRWIQAGQLRAIDVAAHLVESGEWTRRAAPLAAGMRIYRTDKLQHVPLRRRLAHTFDGDLVPLSNSEAAVALLGHALNVVRPRRLDMRRPPSDSPLQPDDCGPIAAVIDAAVTEILARAAMNSANPNPTW